MYFIWVYLIFGTTFVLINLKSLERVITQALVKSELKSYINIWVAEVFWITLVITFWLPLAIWILISRIRVYMLVRKVVKKINDTKR